MKNSRRFRIDAVIFDMDGLLIDSERPSLTAWDHVARKHNIGSGDDVLRRPLFRSLIGVNEATTGKVLARELAGLTDAEQFRRDWIEAYLQLLANEPVVLKPGVLELLEWLKAEDIKRAVATSTAIALAEAKLESVEIRDYFLTVTGGDQVTNGKPAPDIYLAAAASVGAVASSSVGLEDSPNGVRAAHAAGLSVIQVPDLVQPDTELLMLGHQVCDSLHAVKNWMETVHLAEP